MFHWKGEQTASFSDHSFCRSCPAGVAGRNRNRPCGRSGRRNGRRHRKGHEVEADVGGKAGTGKFIRNTGGL